MIKIITAPTAYPVTLTEAKEWARIDSTDTSQNGTLAIIIASATSSAEEKTGRAFVQRTVELNLPYFNGCIDLPWAPLIGIDSIKYTDTDDAEATVAAADYEVDTVSEPGRVQPIYTASWPSLGSGFNRVRIRYRAGYVGVGSPIDLTDNSYLPAKLREWIAARVVSRYDERGHLIAGVSLQMVPRDFEDGLLDSLLLGTRLF